MSRYEFLVFIHVLAAAAWFGAALLAVVLLEVATRASDTPWVVRLGGYDEKLAQFLFIPSAIITLLAVSPSFSMAHGAFARTAG